MILKNYLSKIHLFSLEFNWISRDNNLKPICFQIEVLISSMGLCQKIFLLGLNVINRDRPTWDSILSVVFFTVSTPTQQENSMVHGPRRKYTMFWKYRLNICFSIFYPINEWHLFQKTISDYSNKWLIFLPNSIEDYD